MTEKEFYEAIKDQILDYLPEEYAESRVELHEVMKDNDQMLTGITVVRKNETAVPITYLNEAFDRYQDGVPMEEICRDISNMILSYKGMNIPVKNIDLKYASIKDNLRVKLVNNRTNRKLLQESVNQPVGCGYSFIPYIDLESKEMEGAMVRITKQLAATQGYDEGQIMEDAVKGSETSDGVKLARVEDILFSSDAGIENLLDEDHRDMNVSTLLVLTNASGIYGASSLFLPGIQEKIADSIGCGYYVLPSSVHEVLILPERGDYEASDLVQMVKSVNQGMVLPEEQLGSKVLQYDPALKHMSIAADLDKITVRGVER